MSSEGLRIISQHRGDMIVELMRIKPYKIASFSPLHLPTLHNNSLYVLLHTQAYRSQKEKPNEWVFRTNNKVHLKVAIGRNGCIVGSWNFSEHSTNTMHEMICVIDRATHPEACAEVEHAFDTIWLRSNEQLPVHPFKWER